MLNSYVFVVTNLKPRKLAGVMSNGMILAACKDETIKTLKPSDIPPKLGLKVHL